MSFKKDYTITTISNNLSQRMSSSVSGAQSFQQSSPGILSLRGTGTPYTMVASPEEADAGTAQTPVFPLGRENNPCRIIDMGDWTTSPGGTALSQVPEKYNAYVGDGDFSLSLTGSGNEETNQSSISCSSDADIANLVIDLGHKLGLEVIAEGVETKEQINFLRKYACDQIQGFILSKPVNIEKFEKLLKTKY